MLSLEACMQMVICHRTIISKWKATILHPQPSGL
nr:MAG TPA: hypothetical protein [Caudoviricetes sp.]